MRWTWRVAVDRREQHNYCLIIVLVPSFDFVGGFGGLDRSLSLLGDDGPQFIVSQGDCLC